MIGVVLHNVVGVLSCTICYGEGYIVHGLA